jgi:3-(3-hydroxy-phenyl)propionate hydroxylase
VRAALGLDFEGASYPETWLIVDAVGVPHEIDHVEFLCDPDRPTPHMVAPGGRTRWEFMLKPGETRERMEDDATIRSLLAPWADAHEIVIERKDVYRFHARVCSRFSSERVFLVGDAAHVTPPFTGQGLVAGLRDAANLGWKLAWVVHGRATAAILESYDQERRPHATKMVALAKLMGRIVVPQGRVHAVLIHGGVRMVRRLPPVRRYIDRISMKPRNAFDEGLFARGRGRRGAWMPQVTLGPSRSDDLLGAALTLVGVGVDPERSLTETTARRWAVAGGHTLQLPAGAMRAWCPAGWCAVVRPDRTVMHDGPVAKVEPMVSEALEMLSRAA